MRKPGSRKLVDIGGNGERLELALEGFLRFRSIQFDRHQHHGFVRYAVHIRDLAAAQAVLPALQAIAEDRASGAQP